MGAIELFADLRMKLFWYAIECAKPNPDDGLQSVSWSCTGLDSWALQIMGE